MAREPQTIQIKPVMVNVGRGLELAKVPYPIKPGSPLRLLPPEGATVSLDGADGGYWRRRLNDNVVEVVEVVEPTRATTRSEKGKE